MTTTRLLWAPWIVAAALVLPGCGGPDLQSYCDDRESCLNGNSADVDACVASFKGQRDVASDIGCGDEFDTYYDCVIGKASCRSVNTGMACQTSDQCLSADVTCSGGQCVSKTYDIDSDQCAAETHAWNHCEG